MAFSDIRAWLELSCRAPVLVHDLDVALRSRMALGRQAFKV